MRMRNILPFCSSLFLALSIVAQPATNDLDQARMVVLQAQAAGAATLATSLFEDATSRLRLATDNWEAKDVRLRERARMRAREAMFEAGAALAKARWLSTNVAIRTMQTDIRGFGGTSDLAVPDESPSIDYRRGAQTKYRIAAAQMAIDQAKEAGAMTLAGPDLTTAQQDLESAIKVSRNGTTDNDIADYLAFNSEMIARRAYYEARFRDANVYLPEIRLQRTRLAQAASERQAAAERQQREAAERETAELNRRLAAEQQNRAAQQAELDRLHAQIDETRRARREQIAADRRARITAEQQLDELNRQYLTAISSGAAEADIDTLRRQIEDRELTLRAIRTREELTQRDFEAEIARSRTDLESARTAGSMSAETLSQRQADVLARQAELETLRQERETDLAQRATLERQQTESITEAQRHRQEQEAQAADLRRQAEESQRQALVAQEQAQAAQQQAQAAQQEAQAAHQQAASAQEEAQAAHQQAATAHQQAATAQQQVTEATTQAAQTQAELERTRAQLAERDAETRRLRLQQSLAQYAATRSDPARGIIITLPSIMFDSGKAELKKGAKSTLKNIASQLQSEQTAVITIEGHTDNAGGAKKNLKLSEQRAQAVRDYLVASGINGDHVTAIGRGEADPVAPNKTASGRQANRRVEMIIAP
jgi:outer membrane protein OmpA-like peptidoglycan-associated protein